jgi:Rieske Fe-S protein
MDETTDTTPTTSRRTVLGGAAVLGVATALAACGGTDESSGSTDSADPSASNRPEGETSLGKAKAVPVGSGIIVAEAKAVVTQPVAGEYRAFSYTCTHKGCPVSKISGDTISCLCHGSQFSTTDGSVVKGPAATGLAALAVTEKNGELFLKG